MTIDELENEVYKLQILNKCEINENLNLHKQIKELENKIERMKNRQNCKFAGVCTNLDYCICDKWELTDV